MLILKADRLGTTARIPVCYPVMFQTDWVYGRRASARCVATRLCDRVVTVPDP